jgi:SAM-dependent methyltransferase
MVPMPVGVCVLSLPLFALPKGRRHSEEDPRVMPVRNIRSRLVNGLRGDPRRDPWKVQQYELLASVIADQIQTANSLIDLGCGEGLFTNQLGQRLPGLKSIVGLDLEPSPLWAVDSAVHFQVGDAGDPPFPPGAVDAVIAKDLLHHMDDPAQGVKAIVRTASRVAVIVEANRDNPIMDLYTRHNGDRHFTSGELEALLNREAPEVAWQFDKAVAYPFYLPPVGGPHALWVWPFTGAMLIAFKVFRSQWAARGLSRFTRRLPWPPPFSVAFGQVGRD